MDEKQFAERMVKDDAFMVEIFKEMPDEAFTKDAPQELFVKGMVAAAAKRGWDFDEAKLQEDYNKAIEGLGFGALRFAWRFNKAVKAAGKK